MIHLYTGEGKGKTTAAVGLAVRARGHGWRVLFAQFLKGGPTGECASLRQLGVDVLRLPDPCGFWWNLDTAARTRVVAGHDALLREILARLDGAQPPGLLVLDEFTYVYTTPMADPALCRERKPDADFDGFEPPDAPDLTLDLDDRLRTDRAVDKIIDALAKRGQVDLG